MRESWTDDRLDDLSRRVETGFAQLHADNRELRNAIERIAAESRAELRTAWNDLRAEMKEAFAIEREERRADMKEAFAAEREERQGDIAGVRTEVAALRTEMKESFAAEREERRAEIAGVRREIGALASRIDTLEAQIGALNSRLIAGLFAILATIVGTAAI